MGDGLRKTLRATGEERSRSRRHSQVGVDQQLNDAAGFCQGLGARPLFLLSSHADEAQDGVPQQRHHAAERDLPDHQPLPLPLAPLNLELLTHGGEHEELDRNPEGPVEAEVPPVLLLCRLQDLLQRVSSQHPSSHQVEEREVHARDHAELARTSGAKSRGKESSPG
eukprot:768741-Hanusia_phi.AAC.15